MMVDTQVAQVGQAFATAPYSVSPNELLACRESEWLAGLDSIPEPRFRTRLTWKSVWCHASLGIQRPNTAGSWRAEGDCPLAVARANGAAEDALVAGIAAAKAVARIGCESKLVGKLRWSAPVRWFRRPTIGERLVATAVVDRRARLDERTRALTLAIDIRSWDGARLLGTLAIVIEQSDRIAEVIELLGPITCAA